MSVYYGCYFEDLYTTLLYIHGLWFEKCVWYIHREMCIRNTSEILASLTSIGSCRRWCYYPSLYTWAMTWEISHIYTYIYMSYIYIYIHGLWPEKFLIYIHIHTCRIYTYIYMGYDLRNFSCIYIYIHVIYIHICTWAATWETSHI